MKKDIEWLKEEVDKALRNKVADGINYYDYLDLGRSLKELINQLDEPEVLSSDWIDDNSVYASFDGVTEEYVHVDELQNLLVPKQEDMFNGEEPDEGEVYFAIGLEGAVEINSAISIGEAIERLAEHETNYSVSKKPVIPKFVADWIESRKNNYPFDVIGAYLRMNESFANEQTREVLSWIHESELNRGSFARAWLDGFTVEEQKYRVIDSHKVYLLAKDEDRNEVETVAKFVEIYGYNHAELNYQLTEQEIKDYDPRYMAFAKPVEELEE